MYVESIKNTARILKLVMRLIKYLHYSRLWSNPSSQFDSGTGRIVHYSMTLDAMTYRFCIILNLKLSSDKNFFGIKVTVS